MTVVQTTGICSPLLPQGAVEIQTSPTARMSRVAAMGSNSGYFQFPLCLLAFRDDYKKRLQHIVSYCVCEQARRTNPTFPKSARDSSFDEAASFLHVNIDSYDSTIDRWKEADSFVRRRERRYGRDALVRIGTSLLWEAHNNTGVSYREFSILCAINSIIGERRSMPTRITAPRIRARAAGFKSWGVATAELPSEELIKEKLLTPDQVRYTLDGLHGRKFFARARVGAKTIKYMLRVTDEQLRALLLRQVTYRARFKAERAKKDAELMAAITAAKRQPFSPEKDRDTAVSVLTQPRHRNGMAPDINSCSLNNGSCSNSTAENIAPLSLKSGVVDLAKKEKQKKLDRSQFNDEELAFIELYHRICLPTGLRFLPVTRRSKELDKALDRFAVGFDEQEWTKNFGEAVRQRREVFRTNPRVCNTLVQICWKLNY